MESSDLLLAAIERRYPALRIQNFGPLGVVLTLARSTGFCRISQRQLSAFAAEWISRGHQVDDLDDMIFIVTYEARRAIEAGQGLVDHGESLPTWTYDFVP
jgi:hypothetical protein